MNEVFIKKMILKAYGKHILTICQIMKNELEIRHPYF